MSDLNAYRKFLSTCPMIGQHVIFRDASPGTTGFEYRIQSGKPTAQTNLVPNTPDTPKTINTSSSKDTLTQLKSTGLDLTLANVDEEGYYSCHGTPNDFGLLMAQVWFYMNSYSVAHPHDDLSTMWLKWQNEGLSANSDFQQVKRILSVESLDEFYLFLQDCSHYNIGS